MSDLVSLVTTLLDITDDEDFAGSGDRLRSEGSGSFFGIEGSGNDFEQRFDVTTIDSTSTEKGFVS